MPSKFTELIDTSVAPSYSARNVSLEDILKEMGERRGSQSGGYGSDSSSPTSSEQTSSTAKKLRRLTLGKKP